MDLSTVCALLENAQRRGREGKHIKSHQGHQTGRDAEMKARCDGTCVFLKYIIFSWAVVQWFSTVFFFFFFTQIWHWTSSGDLTWIIYQYFQALQILKPVWKEIHPIIDVPASMTSLSFRHSHDMNWIRKLIWILHLKLIRKLNNEITIM